MQYSASRLCTQATGKVQATQAAMRQVALTQLVIALILGAGLSGVIAQRGLRLNPESREAFSRLPSSRRRVNASYGR